MKTTILKLIIVLFTFGFGQAQEKENKIIFVELINGLSIYNNNEGSSLGFVLNYHLNKNLYAARFISNNFEKRDGSDLSFVLPSFLEITKTKINEIGLLFGKRFITKRNSFSFSLGASFNFYDSEFTKRVSSFLTNMETKEIETYSKNYFGLPFELNIRWSKKNKSKYRVLELIPIGKKTTLGNSLGIKIFGNLSENSLIGFGITLGIGTHKKYGINLKTPTP